MYILHEKGTPPSLPKHDHDHETYVARATAKKPTSTFCHFTSA